MFSTIDNKLIVWFQWLVRQVELCTNKTRKDIIGLNLLVLKVLMFITSCPVFFLFYEIMVDGGKVFILLEALYLGTVVIFIVEYHSLKKINISSSHNMELPKEIVTRENIRVSVLIQFLPLLYMVISTVIHLFDFQLEVSIWVKVSVFFITNLPFFFTIFVFCCEYLLCTTSLPPGEKEERKIKKEMESMELQPIRN